ncbi:MAG: UDP-N-acetylenolpyruvoylglucosamine reductase [Verrucomicrobia bacterium]|nr:UDP-N-acetylenolpyruvoylglucosamine reductase [Verrucomicrobiota bacterium]
MISLRKYNTFGIEATADDFVEINSTTQAIDFFSTEETLHKKHLILGGGSNILLRGDFNGLVIKNSILGIDVIEENETEVTLKVGAGENWHDFVLFCLKNGYYGLENLSLIPGNVGASPMQNIGAYGVEVKEFISTVIAVEIANGNIRAFNKQECHFDYRSSIFKTLHRGKYFIVAVHFKLSKIPFVKIEYGAIRQQLEAKRIDVNQIHPKDVSDAVIEIRKRKLPNPIEIGNAGSFFKNPIVSSDKRNELLKHYEDLPSFAVSKVEYKLAAGWLIEKAGWKGHRKGDCGVHEHQALVLVNYKNATGEEIYQLSEEILQSVKRKFEIVLEREVNII